MRLLLSHPEVAFRPCSDCLIHVYELNGKRKEYRGKPMKRPKGTKPPCRYHANACPKGSPETSKELSDKNIRAYQHYKECVAVGQFPDDPVVRRNAAIIRAVEESVKEERMLLAQMLRG